MAAALSLAGGRLPPTLGLASPAWPLNHVLAPARADDIERVLVNAMAPGGGCVALVLGKGGRCI